MPAAVHPRSEKARLAALRSYQVLDTGPEDAFDNLARLAARLTKCPTAMMSLVAEDRQWFKARLGTDIAQAPRELAFCAHAILAPQQPLVVPDATLDARFADNPMVAGPPGVRFYAGAPLVTPDGQALGTICAIDYTPKDIRPEDLTMLSQIARIAMSILDFRRTVRQARGAALSVADRVARAIEGWSGPLLLCDGAGAVGRVTRQADPRQAFLGDKAAALDDAAARFGPRKDNSGLPARIGLNPIDLADGTLVLAVPGDAGDRPDSGPAKDAWQAELERSNAELQTFAFAVSHDLKAPLRGIGELAGWIRDDLRGVAKPGTIEHLDMLQGRVARLGMLVDGMLAGSRAGRPDALEEDVDIAGMVREVVAMLAIPPGFAIACEAEPAVVRTHRAPLYTVLLNLIGNAWQHHGNPHGSPEGRARGRIDVSMRLLDGLAEFRVRDDGPGLAEPWLAPQAREMGGLGLVKSRIARNGGMIHVESHPRASGSTFVFTWKVSPPCQRAASRSFSSTTTQWTQWPSDGLSAT